MKSKPLRSGRPTISDVAAESGVSTAAVSQILNGKGRASAATRELVMSTAQRIGYDANPMARGLRTGNTDVLGIFFRPADAIPGSLMGTEFHVRLAGSAAAQALSLGYGLLHTPDPLAPGTSAYPMDGCVVVGPVGNDAVVTALLDKGIPVVCVDPDPDRPERVLWVGRQEGPAIDSLLTHLRQQGARTFALISVNDDIAWKRGFVRAFAEWCDAETLPGQVFELPGDSGSEGARQLVRRIISQGTLPDAIVCATSRFAIGVANAAKEAGIGIPERLLLSALSDSELARSHSPQITALDLHGDVLGQLAIAKLVKLIRNPSDNQPEQIIPTLRLRSSTQRVPGNA